MRRVVITACGVTSPIGNDFMQFSEGLFAGDTGARLLEELFGSDLHDVPVAFGAPVKNTAEVARARQCLENPHKSTTFALAALQQILVTAPDVVCRASLQCGVGIGQLLPDLADLVEAAAAFHDALLQRGNNAQLRPDHARESALFSDAGALQLQRVLGLQGPVRNFVSACAAATQACIQACEEVLFGADVAIGGGHDSLLSVAGIYLMHELGTLSTNSRAYRSAVRPFDRERDGTMIGEGAAYFLFEEAQHARQRGAEIMAEVVGYGSSLDGYHVTSPEPTGRAGIRMIEDALAMAGIDGSRIDYVNAHGTATSMNDAIETQIIQQSLQGNRPFVSSTKPQIGHLIAACGAVELAACVAALRFQRVPPNCNLETPDPECDLRFPELGGPSATLDYALCNSFGFGGQNACMILRRWNAD